MKYWYTVDQWDGGRYVEADVGYLEAASLEEAVARVRGWEDNLLLLGYEPVDGAIDLRVNVYDLEAGEVAEPVYLLWEE